MSPLENDAQDAEGQRRQKLVLAAYDLLDEKGLEGLTIRAVLDRTGLARRAFYDSFAGKDDLVLAVFEQTLRAAARQFRAETASIEDPVERLHTIISVIILGRLSRADMAAGGGNRRSAALAREHMRLAEARPTELLEAISPLVTVISDAVEDGMKSGLLRSADPCVIAMMIYNLVSGMVHTQLLAEEQQAQSDRERRLVLVQHIWDFCRAAIIAA